MLAPGAVGDHPVRIGGVARNIYVARARQGDIAAVRGLQLRAGPPHEFVDIAMIVGEQDVALHMFGGRAGIMPEPGQREIGAGSVEQGEGAIAVRAGKEQAIGNLVPYQCKVGAREMRGQFAHRYGIEAPHVESVEHIRERNLLLAWPDLHRHAVIGDEQVDLLGKIVAEYVGAGHCGDIAPGAGQPGKGAPGARGLLGAVISDRYFRVDKVARACRTRYGCLAARIVLDRAFQ
jgi:hypothetical protein